MGYLGQNVTFKTVEVNESNFVEVLSGLIKDPYSQIIFSSNDLHEISKKGWCLNVPEGYTNDGKGTCMMTSEGIMHMCKIKYVVYSFDLYDNLPKVESYLINFFDKRGVSRYFKRDFPRTTYLLKYVPRT